MNLEQLTIAIRPRRAWEAVDLGLLMARHWWTHLFAVWLIITLPLYLPILFFTIAQSWWYLSLIWLCKPLFERPLLLILSQGVFGSTPTIKDVLRATPKLLLLQVIPSLTWRRFSPTRSMDLAVLQLEGLRGTERSTRLNTLHRQDSSPATWISLLGLMLELLLLFALLGFLRALVPSEIDFHVFADSPFEAKGVLLIWAGLYFLAMACAAPFYVACGFSLYLNRRVKLEGWDLEIAFKRMVQVRGFRALGMAPLVLGLFLCLTQIQPSQAQPEVDGETTKAPLTVPHDRQATRESLREIISREPFHTPKTVKRIKPKPIKENEQKNANFVWSGMEGLFEWLAAVMNILALYLELALWGLVLAIIVLVLLRFKTWQNYFSERLVTNKTRYQPTHLFGMDVTVESMPDDVGAHALSLWQQGQHRAALALLYRASLARLLVSGLPLRDGTTEFECLQIVRDNAVHLQVPSPVVDYFAQLTGLWRRLAYGHIEPPEQLALDLCQTWNQHWQASHHES